MSSSMHWIETLDLHGPTHAQGLKPDQSVELEKRMHDAAALSVKEGYRRLSELKVPASRRLDFMAEMLKDDKQMTKIRTRLVEAQQRIDAVESRKKKTAQQKFAKQLKAAKIEKKKQETIDKKLSKPSMKPIDKRESRQDGFVRRSNGKGGKGKSGKGKGGKGKGMFGRGGKGKFGQGGKGKGKGGGFSKFRK